MSDTRCVLPWMHLATHPNGGVSLCCRSNHTNAVSWAKKSSTNSLVMLDNDGLDDVINSETFVRVRQQMLDGQRPTECEGCWQDEDAGIVSKRQYENSRWSHIINELEPTAYLNNPGYRYVELRLGNICNNACVTCNSYSSSKWYPDEKRIAKDLPWFNLRPMENFKWFESPNFYSELAEYSANVEEIYINGGEPTLISAHFEYLKKLIQDGYSKKIHLVYSLNMMDIPDMLIALWQNFKQVTVNCSIDDLLERNFYIRWPTKWTDTISSIEKLQRVPTVQWHVTQTVSILNVDNLHNFGLWLENTYGKTPHHNYVLYPDYLSLAALPNDYKSKLKNLYKDKLNPHQRTELFAKLDMPHDSALTVKAKEFITALDKSRKMNYRDYIPVMEEIFKC
jgi:Iron-sulfur cluster-binding domain